VRIEVEEFLQGVDRLRDDAERLEARIAKRESRARAATGPDGGAAANAAIAQRKRRSR
jgi:hypothetical protein